MVLFLEFEFGVDEIQGEFDFEYELFKKFFVVVFFICFLMEKVGELLEVIEVQKELIRDKILNWINEEFFEDKKIWKFLCELVGDFMINVFVCNFKIGDDINQDVVSLLLFFIYSEWWINGL